MSDKLSILLNILLLIILAITSPHNALAMFCVFWIGYNISTLVRQKGDSNE